MRTFVLGVVAVLAMSAIASAAIVSHDFEDGTNGSVPVGYTGVGTAPAVISTDQNTTAGGSKSVKTPGNATVNYTGAADYNIVGMTAKNWEASWSFYSEGATREYVQLRSYSGGGASGDLQQLISFGHYNAAPADVSKYNFRVTVGSVGWTNTNIDRVNNTWHTMKVTQTDNGNGTATLNFYVDGTLGGTANTTSVFPLTQIRIGSSLTNGGMASYFDDINVTPEPATLALLASGLFLVRRRRA